MIRQHFVAAVLASLATVETATESLSHAQSPHCDVTVSVTATGGQAMASVNTRVLYTNVPGDFEGLGNAATCTALPAGTTMFNKFDDEANRRINLMVTTSKAAAFPSGSDFVSCKWIPDGRFPLDGEFQVGPGSTTALDATGKFISATAAISSVDCFGEVSTTTTTTEAPTTTTTLPTTLCGDYDGNGLVKSSDALGVLRAAVGQQDCPLCVCDVNANGTIAAGDALKVLQIAVGGNVALNCNPC